MGKVVVSIFSAVLSVAGVLIACNNAVGDVNRAAQVVREYRNA